MAIEESGFGGGCVSVGGKGEWRGLAQGLDCTHAPRPGLPFTAPAWPGREAAAEQGRGSVLQEGPAPGTWRFRLELKVSELGGSLNATKFSCEKM